MICSGSYFKEPQTFGENLVSLKTAASLLSIAWPGMVQPNLTLISLQNKSTKIDTKHWKWHRHWPSRHSPVFSPGWTFARSQRNGHSTYAFCTHGRRSRTFLSKRTGKKEIMNSWTILHLGVVVLFWRCQAAKNSGVGFQVGRAKEKSAGALHLLGSNEHTRSWCDSQGQGRWVDG